MCVVTLSTFVVKMCLAMLLHLANKADNENTRFLTKIRIIEIYSIIFILLVKCSCRVNTLMKRFVEFLKVNIISVQPCLTHVTPSKWTFLSTPFKIIPQYKTGSDSL